MTLRSKILAGSLLFLGLLLFAFAEPADAGERVTAGVGYSCIRHGHGDDKFCPSQTTYLPGGYDSYGGSFTLSGHRHGGSNIWAELCVIENSGGDGDCVGFYGRGSQLGTEYGGIHPYNRYTGKSFSGNNRGGYHVTYWLYVDDAEAKWDGSMWGERRDEPQPTHFACRNRACAVVPGEGSDECSRDSECRNVDPTCNPPHSAPVNGRCVPSCGAAGGTMSGDAGSNVCDGMTILEAYDVGVCCRPPGGEGGYQGGYESGYEGNYQSGYEGGYQGGSESGYEGGYYGEGYYYAEGAYPPVCSFTSSHSRVVIPPPAKVTLTWDCQNASSCDISPAVGGVEPSGSTLVSPGQSTTYTLSCSGPGGSADFETGVRVYIFSNGSLKEITPQ